jgi:hypothetical protein
MVLQHTQHYNSNILFKEAKECRMISSHTTIFNRTGEMLMCANLFRVPSNSLFTHA